VKFHEERGLLQQFRDCIFLPEKLRSRTSRKEKIVVEKVTLVN